MTLQLLPNLALNFLTGFVCRFILFSVLGRMTDQLLKSNNPIMPVQRALWLSGILSAISTLSL